MSDAVVDLLKAITENMRHADEGWTSLSMVLELQDGELCGSYGYLYSHDGTPSATAVKTWLIEQATDAYFAGYYEPGAPRPVKLLVQLDREAGRYEVTFEDADEDRWAVTPENIDTIRQELRPNFD